MRVTASVLNVRSGPGTNFRVVHQLRRSDQVSVLETHGDWAWVDPGMAWVHRAFLESVVAVPTGLAGLRAAFGEPASPAASAGLAVLPASLKLGWSDARITRFACHVEMADIFTRVFQTIHARGLWGAIRTFDGCYNPRQTRGGGKWSTHAWGIAVDLNAATNRMGTQGDIDHRIVSIFKEAGFVWGGDWSGASRDPMHFQFVKGY
jgi:hypothetical protein